MLFCLCSEENQFSLHHNSPCRSHSRLITNGFASTVPPSLIGLRAHCLSVPHVPTNCCRSSASAAVTTKRASEDKRSLNIAVDYQPIWKRSNQLGLIGLLVCRGFQDFLALLCWRNSLARWRATFCKSAASSDSSTISSPRSVSNTSSMVTSPEVPP